VIDHQAHAEVAGRFGRAAERYDDAAGVQRDICNRLSRLADGQPPAEGWLLDAGCGTGFGVGHLRARYPDRRVLGLDLAPQMLARLSDHHPQAWRAAADMEALPLVSGCAGGIWSSLSLQWCDPGQVFREFARVLAPGGVVWLATLGPRTFHELRHAFQGVDAARHVLECPARQTVVAAASDQALSLVTAEEHLLSATAPNLAGLLRDIKAVGAQGVGAGRRRGMLGRDAWREIEARYERFRRADGAVAISYDAQLLILRKSS